MKGLALAVGLVGVLLGGCAGATEYRLGDDGKVRKYVGKEIPGPGIRVLPPDKPKSQYDLWSDRSLECETTSGKVLCNPMVLPHELPPFR